jgi:hypothetical protein
MWVCLCAVGFMNQRYMLATLCGHLDMFALPLKLHPPFPLVLLLTAFTESANQMNFRNIETASIVEDG